MAASLKVSIEGKGSDQVLVIRCPMNKPRPSASGKTLVVASTHGNVETEVEINGETVKLGLNAYIKNNE